MIDTAGAEIVTHGMTEATDMAVVGTETEKTAITEAEMRGGKITGMTEGMAGLGTNRMEETIPINPDPKNMVALHSNSVITRLAVVGTPLAVVTAVIVKTIAEKAVAIDVGTSGHQEVITTAHAAATTGTQEVAREKAGSSTRIEAARADTRTTIKEVVTEGASTSRIAIGHRTNAVTDGIMTTTPVTETGRRRRGDRSEKVREQTQVCLSGSGWLACPMLSAAP